MSKLTAKRENSPDAVYVAVGRALSEWENLEGVLAHWFQGMLSSKSIAPFRAYGAIIGFQARANMLIAAAEVYFGEIERPDLLEKFKSMVNNLKDISSIRNNIAHGSVGCEDDGYWLSPSAQTKKLTLRGERKYRYNAADIDRHRESFRQATLEVSKFFAEVFFPKAPE
jgi:hypothetical protein